MALLPGAPQLIPTPNAEAPIRSPALPLVVALLSVSCTNIVAISPIIPAGAEVRVDHLVGRWMSAKSPQEGELSIARRGETTYLIGISEHDSTIWYDGRFTRLGDLLLLDVTPTDSERLAPGPEDPLTIHAHSLLIVDGSKDRLSFRTFNPESLQAGLRNGKITLPYNEVDGVTIVGGSTGQLWKATRELLATNFPLRTFTDEKLDRVSDH